MSGQGAEASLVGQEWHVKVPPAPTWLLLFPSTSFAPGTFIGFNGAVWHGTVHTQTLSLRPVVSSGRRKAYLV